MICAPQRHFHAPIVEHDITHFCLQQRCSMVPGRATRLLTNLTPGSIRGHATLLRLATCNLWQKTVCLSSSTAPSTSQANQAPYPADEPARYQLGASYRNRGGVRNKDINIEDQAESQRLGTIERTTNHRVEAARGRCEGLGDSHIAVRYQIYITNIFQQTPGWLSHKISQTTVLWFYSPSSFPPSPFQ
jgi:hypothetical protein